MQQKYSSLLDPLSSPLSQHSHVFIRQKATLLEAVTCGCFEQANSYALLDPQLNQIMTVDEKSTFCARMCCNPIHSLVLEFTAGEGGREGGAPVLFTAHRPGCFCSNPCIGCVACCSICSDKMTLMSAGVTEAPIPIMMCRQASAWKAPLRPAIYVMPIVDGVVQRASHRMAGPSCFGGCMELWARSTWRIEDSGGVYAGRITKDVPVDFGDLAREISTDADYYRVDFEEDMSADSKAAVVTAALLVDFMYYENDLGICKTTEDGAGCQTTLCNVYCCGMVCPCGCKSSSGGGSRGIE
jgi:hypothetical protein